MGGRDASAVTGEQTIPDEGLKVLTDHKNKEQERLERYGNVRPIIHSNFKGHKFVAVGAELHYSPTWKTFHDFLFGYVKTVLVRAFGPDWSTGEFEKPLERRHPILRWYDALCELQRGYERGPDGIYEGVIDGQSAAYLLLAYDLYILADNLRLQEQVLARLKDVTHFRGARYELAVAATMVRAGFDIDFEDESDNRRKHPEFIATHKRTGEIVAVEAKSRGRSGVMGWLGPKPDLKDFRVGLDELLRNAIRKATNLPYLIFLDANMPPEIAWGQTEEWVQEVREMISRLGHGFSREGIFVGAPFSGLFITNFPHDYAERGDVDPAKLAFISQPTIPRNPLRFPGTITDIDAALRQYGNVPKDFPT